MANNGRNGTGRIYPHNRDANFTGTILGDSIVLDNKYVEGIQDTEKFSIDINTKRGHRNRIKEIYTFWEANFSDYYAVGVRQLSVEDKSDTTKYHWKNQCDIVYEGLNAKFIKAFISTKTTKSNGKTMSYDHIRKYFDSVQYGAKEAKVRLPVSFYSAKDTFLQSYKKKVARAKATGDTDESEADPIPFSLFVLICAWSVGEGNIFLWAWTVLQWNLMGRSINVEPLCFHNLTVFADTIKIVYDSNKADQGGDNVTIKHVYANPVKPQICSYLALGIYLCLNALRYEKVELIFRKGKEEKKKVASTGYCSQLKELMTRKASSVKNFIRLAHANAHDWRKGSATYATSGTTCPPSTPSIARRGEWSMGKVLDLYWHFAETGDYYLGRVVAGLDALLSTFKILPPHFVIEDPMENIFVCEAMEIMYGPILTTWANTPQDPTALLLRLLASVVYHMKWVNTIAQTRTDHPFNSIPIVSKPRLVEELTKLISTEPSAMISEATGIPPHVEQSMKLHTLLSVTTECLSLLKNQFSDIKKVCNQFIIF